MAEKEVRVWIDRPDVRDEILLGNEELRKLEYEYMAKVLSQIQAEFFQTFGFAGNFELNHEPTVVRERYYIRSSDAKTTAALKKRPGWLGKFVTQEL